jgi:hypothetical protein
MRLGADRNEQYGLVAATNVLEVINENKKERLAYYVVDHILLVLLHKMATLLLLPCGGRANHSNADIERRFFLVSSSTPYIDLPKICYTTHDITFPSAKSHQLLISVPSQTM